MAKRYWLKLQSTFFDQAEICIVQGMPDGRELIQIWLKMLLLTVRGGDEIECGILRVNEKIPYTPSMLGSVIKESPAMIEKAIQVFQNLNMLDVAPDGTIYIEAVQRMMGKETDSAERMRKFRHKKELAKNGVTMLQEKITTCDNKEEEVEEEKEVDIDDALAASTWDAFLSKAGTFTSYAKERKMLTMGLKRMRKLYGDKAETMTKAFMETFWALKQGTAKFWNQQPFTPSAMFAAAIFDRIKEEVEHGAPTNDVSWVGV